MKKAFNILICMLMCVMLISCSVPIEESVSEKNTTSPIAVDESAVSEKSTKPDKATEKTNKKPSESKDKTNEEKVTSSTQGSTSTTTSSAGGNGTASASTKKKSPNEKDTTKTKTTKKKTTTSTTESTVKCSITIEYKSILDNMDDLKAGHESFISPDGYILNSYSVTLDDGASVLDALELACKENNIRITMSNSVYSTYIVGFNNIDEKDCGSGSGWLYFVNDKSPNISTKKYIVKNGDKILFSYICR